MPRLSVIALVVLSAMGISPVRSNATDCCGPCIDSLSNRSFSKVEDMPQLAEYAPILFVGMVVKAETLECCDRFADVTFRVKKVWKGSGLTTPTVRTGAGCARPFPFAIGQEYLVAATGAGGREGVLFLDLAFTPLGVSAAQQHIQALDDWRRAKFDAETAK